MTAPSIPPMRIETQDIEAQNEVFFFTVRKKKRRSMPGSQLSNRSVWHLDFHIKPKPHDPKTEGLNGEVI